MSFIFAVVFGWIKNRIYTTDVANGIARPTTLDELWDRVVQVWWDIPQNTLVKIRTNYNDHRIQKLINASGLRFENEAF